MTRALVLVIALPAAAMGQSDSLVFRDASRSAPRPDSLELRDAAPGAGRPDSVFFEEAGPPPGTRALASIRYFAPADAPYRAEEVRVRTSENIFLGGTLTIPRLTPIRTQSGRRVYPRVPAVILISGAGADDRDHSASGGAYRPFHQVADTLSRRGLAVLRLDDRGVGSSSGRLDSATTLDRANDARGAIEYLRRRADVDPNRIALLGLSEGAIIATMIAGVDSTVAAVVLMACPGSSGAALARERVERWVDERGGYGRSERDSVVADILAEWSARGPTDRWTRFYLSYDPLVAARRVRQPALVLQGEADTIVPAGHAELLAHAMRTAGNRDVTVRTFRELGHAFVRGARALPGDPAGPLRSDLPGSPAGWRPAPEPANAKDLEEPGDPDDVRWPREVLGSIADWLTARLKARSSAHE